MPQGDRPYRLFAVDVRTGRETRSVFEYADRRDAAADELRAKGYTVFVWDVLRLPEHATATA